MTRFCTHYHIDISQRLPIDIDIDIFQNCLIDIDIFQNCPKQTMTMRFRECPKKEIMIDSDQVLIDSD